MVFNKCTKRFKIESPWKKKKILGQQLFRTREFPRSGSKAKDGEKRKRKEEREKDRTMVITMAKLRMAHASRLGQK